jgi:hypothetical protein
MSNKTLQEQHEYHVRQYKRYFNSPLPNSKELHRYHGLKVSELYQKIQTEKQLTN